MSDDGFEANYRCIRGDEEEWLGRLHTELAKLPPLDLEPPPSSFTPITGLHNNLGQGLGLGQGQGLGLGQGLGQGLGHGLGGSMTDLHSLNLSHSHSDLNMNVLPEGYTITPAEYERMNQFLSNTGESLSHFLTFSLPGSGSGCSPWPAVALALPLFVFFLSVTLFFSPFHTILSYLPPPPSLLLIPPTPPYPSSPFHTPLPLSPPPAPPPLFFSQAIL